MRKLTTCCFSIVCLLFITQAAAAKPHLNYGKELNAAKCSPGAGNKMVLNIVYQVINDADSGNGGYWAMDSYLKHVQVWDTGGGTFCVQVKYDGSFVTVDGNSPAGSGHVGGGVSGTMEGGYNAIIMGTFNPGSNRTKGNIGTKDYGCSISNGAATGCNYYDWIGDYFSDVSNFEYAYWGWIYHAGDNGTWVNASTGNDGDITGNP